VITLTLAQLIEAAPAFTRLARKELPLKVALHIARVYRQVVAEQQAFEEKRLQLVMKLGQRVNGTPQVRVAPEHIPEFSRQINEAAAVELRLDCQPLTWADLQGIEDLRLPAEDLILLGPFMADRPDGEDVLLRKREQPLAAVDGARD
jgi:hypothetical protein